MGTTVATGNQIEAQPMISQDEHADRYLDSLTVDFSYLYSFRMPPKFGNNDQTYEKFFRQCVTMLPETHSLLTLRLHWHNISIFGEGNDWSELAYKKALSMTLTARPKILFEYNKEKPLLDILRIMFRDFPQQDAEQITLAMVDMLKIPRLPKENIMDVVAKCNVAIMAVLKHTFQGFLDTDIHWGMLIDVAIVKHLPRQLRRQFFDFIINSQKNKLFPTSHQRVLAAHYFECKLRQEQKALTRRLRTLRPLSLKQLVPADDMTTPKRPNAKAPGRKLKFDTAACQKSPKVNPNGQLLFKKPLTVPNVTSTGFKHAQKPVKPQKTPKAKKSPLLAPAKKPKVASPGSILPD